jgi:sugar lactone lactonase YvrE/DNA-binding IclR family transcriptional regulator
VSLEPKIDLSQAGDVPGAQALLRGLDVLLAIGTAARPPRFRDLEKAVGIPRASLHRLLAALSSRRLIRYDERTKTYQVGMRVLELSRRTLDQSGIIRAAKPELARLARRLQRTVCIMVLDDHDVFVLDFEDADPSYGRLVRLWPRARALEAAAGRALLAAMPKENSEKLIAEMEPADNHDVRLGSELSVAKALGYAVLSREAVSGRAGAAAAIVDETGYPMAAIACLFETDQVPPEELHEVGRILAEGARRASGHIGMGYNMPAVLPRPQTSISDCVEVLPTGRDFVGENPVWHAAQERLYWVDVLAPALRYWDPVQRTAGRVNLPQITAGIAFDDKDRIVAAGESGIFLLDPRSGATTPLVNPEADRPDNRFNTAGVDPKGRFWAGTMALNHEVGRGSLYSLDPGLMATRRLERVGMPKNVAFDPSGTRLYFSDAAENAIFLFEFDVETGFLGERRKFATGGEGRGQLNGITVDAEGYVWAACLGAWCVRRFAPDGSFDREITLPVPMPTNCSFGGSDLTTLYVTSTYIRQPPGVSSQAPASGQLIAVHTGIRGQDPVLLQSGR